MADRTCPNCDRKFQYPRDLKIHLNRKTPCAPIINNTDLSEEQQAKPYDCRYCGRRYATQPGLSRHVKQTCQIANSDEGMEKLFEHTLQRQLEEQRFMLESQQAQIAELAGLLKDKLALEPKKEPQVAHQIQNNAGPVQNNIDNKVVTNIVIQNFDAERCLQVPAELVRRLFTTNARLKEFITNGPVQEDAEAAVPYVLEALLQITREVHRDPQQRNV